MDSINLQKQMLIKVAEALGPELLKQVTFVGGCTTGLLLTDEFTKEQVRSTDDVDLIVSVIGHIGFHKLQEQLRCQGFRDSTEASEEDSLPICAMQLDALRVDFMPDDEGVLGFSNSWYKRAVETAAPYALTDQLSIRLVTPVYFMATKLEAWKGRGKNDPLESRDMEDILNLVDGRAELLDEIKRAGEREREYIAGELALLRRNPFYSHALQAATGGDSARERRLHKIITQLAVLS
jgi:predicted nucleotidyltransferase